LFHNGGGAIFGKDVSKADYAVPLFLTKLAKEIVEKDNAVKTRPVDKIFPAQAVELQASTIIGDETVEIYHNSEMLYRAGYQEIMEFAKALKVDIFGGVDFGGAK
jgi:hypothetical protein